MFELTKEEAKILYNHLIERQEGCYFVGEIADIFCKLTIYINEEEVI